MLISEVIQHVKDYSFGIDSLTVKSIDEGPRATKCSMATPLRNAPES